MKTRFLAYAFAGITLAAGITSCSQEVEPVLPVSGDQVSATFQLNLPVEEATRSFGDGTKALQLTYVFYEKNATTGALSIVGTADSSKVFENLNTTVNVNLVSGKSYTMVCWAQDAACTAYTFTAPADAAPTVDVTYDGVLQNDENRDAFYAAYDFTVTGPLSETVTLYRPFAQINVGTSDLDEASVVTSFGADAAKLRTTLSTKAYTNLNLISGAVSGQEEVNFGLAGIPSRTDEEFPYMPETYGYLSMDYILVPADKSLVDVTFNVYSTDDETTALNTVNVTDVPVQRNYRTNIFGQMLTTTGEFNVVIEPAFNEPPYNVKTELPVLPNGNYSVASPVDLQTMARKILEGETFEGKVIVLSADIDMSGIDWKAPGPINEGANNNFTHLFAGIFDGNNHTISNLTCNTTGYRSSAGLFGAITGEIRNVVLENVSITGAQYVGAVCSYFETGAGTKPSVTNCHVKGGKIETSNFTSSGIGGIVGYAEGHTNITGCSVDGLTIKAPTKVGGILGMTALCNVTDCSVKNTTITKTRSTGYSGVFYGNSEKSSVCKLTNCTEENVTLN